MPIQYPFHAIERQTMHRDACIRSLTLRRKEGKGSTPPSSDKWWCHIAEFRAWEQTQSTKKVECVQTQSTKKVECVQTQSTKKVDCVQTQSTKMVECVQTHSTKKVECVQTQSTKKVECV